MANPEFLVWASNVGYRGNDIHLVRSASVKVASEELKQFLRVELDDGSIADLPGGTTVTYDINVPSPGAFTPPDTFPNHYGFEPNLATGVITLEKAPTAFVIHNFIITAKAVVPGVTDPLTAMIRIHIHESRGGVVLQPDPLHLRKNTALRLSVLATFNDGIGDVSYHPGLTWTTSASLVVGADPHLPPPPAPGQPENPDDERAFKDGGFISPAPGTSATSGTVKVNLPVSLGGPTGPGDGEATVTIIEAWDALPQLSGGGDPYKAQFIVGPGVEKRLSPQVRNVLFLPEGFLPSEKALFAEIADKFAKVLDVLPAFRPLDVLQCNYFRLWLDPYADAARSGVTELQELYPELPQVNAPPATPQFRASSLPDPTRVEFFDPMDTDTTKKRETQAADLLEQLVYLVGLPVSLEPKGNLTAQMTEWNRLYLPGYVKFATGISARVQTMVFDRWKVLQRRGLTVETDTLFQLATGGRPNVDVAPAMITIGPHPLRYVREDLEPFLNKIFVVDSKGVNVTLGFLWTNFASKDVDLVYFITRGQRDAGASTQSGKLSPALPDRGRRKRRQVSSSLNDNPEPLFEESFQHFLPVTVVEPIPRNADGTVKISLEQAATVAHELAHSMLCGDEYGQGGTTANDVDQVFVDEFWNLQTATEVGGTTATGPVQTAKIRWLLPRVSGAGIMKTPLSPTDTGIDPRHFSVEMRAGHVDPFKKDDLVRFRPAALLTRAAAGAPLQFHQPPALFKVTTVVADTVNLELIEPVPGAFTNNSAAGNILYRPARSSGADELVIHPAILSLLASSGVLTRKTNDCDPNAGSYSKEQKPRRPLPAGFRYPATRSSIVGLYDGGRNRRCGIYHPTGKCIMRLLTWIRNPDKKNATNDITPFCHVCRYIIADLVDPRRHDVINKEFKAITTKAAP